MTLRLREPKIASMVMIGVQKRATEHAIPVKTIAEPTEAQQEQAWIDAVKAGDVNAFQFLVEAQQTRVYYLALRMLGNVEEAQDTAQDAFLQAYKRLASYRPEWRFKTWVMAITSNLCIDRLRRRRIEPVTFSDHTEDPDAEFVSHEPQPDVVAVRNERKSTVRAMLEQLPAEDRSMVVMFYWGDMSYDDISRVTGASVNAVKSRLFRARRALAQSPIATKLSEVTP
jgi:RNA polymerase sigma-70 factor, ECF subfamily